ncbi:MAG: hypothetical protein JWM14_1622 [Chitinophagaceae bacterium]|nr:hypothetical protein [Chitinophagaceae bacterium]
MPISIDVLRVGKKYYLVNHGERFEFSVIEALFDNNFRLKDLSSLEEYQLNDLIQFGKGNDYDLEELPV